MTGHALGREGAGALVVTLALAAAIALLVHGPIPQDVAYHRFADARPWFGVRNGADVFSNLPFLAAGFAGFLALARSRRASSPPPRWVRIAFACLSLGVAATTFGSAIYHLDPRNETLVYDRLPLAVGFAALTALVLGERLGPRVGRAALVPAIAAGVGGVWLWAASLDERGGDDLRVYAFVQYASLLAIATLLIVAPKPRATRRPLTLAILAYLAAKALELADGPVLRATAGLVSGHSAKHLAAAVAAFLLVRWWSSAVAHGTWRDDAAS